MFNEILSRVNWVDLLVGGIAIFCVYNGIIKGGVVEFFKVLGMLFSTFLALHYYGQLAEILHHLIVLPMRISEPVAFVLIWGLVVLAFKFIRDGLTVMIKSEGSGWIHKTGGALLGLVRAVLIGGLTMALFFVTNDDILIKFAQKSYSGLRLAHLSLNVYDRGYDMISLLFPGEKKSELKLMGRAK